MKSIDIVWLYLTNSCYREYPGINHLQVTVLTIANPLFPIGPAGTGADQIASAMERAVVRSGWKSLVVASEGSATLGRLAAALPGPGSSGEHFASIISKAANYVRQASNAVDIIHFHGLGFDRYLFPGVARKVATLHAARSYYPDDLFKRKDLQFVAVSHHQAQSFPDVAGLQVIENGVDLDRFRPRPGLRRSLVYLGRIAPEKGPDIALRVAHALDLPLVIAGPLHSFRDHQEYFQRHVFPLLDEKRRFVGPLNPDQRISLLAEARCVLVPSDPRRVSETSSLVSMETASCGVPVVAFPSGALSEVVRHGITGILANSEEEMMLAVRRSADLSPVDCRAGAELRFDERRMVQQYFSCYRSLLRKE